MSGLSGYCTNCKKEVELLVGESFLTCPQFGHRLERPQNRNEKSEFLEGLIKCVRLMFIVAFVLAGIFLVLLAFLYAACSHLGNI
jgi:hypothetical protein